MCFILTAEDKITKKKYAIKTESKKSEFPLLMYEAHVSLLVQGIQERDQYFHNHVENGPREDGFA